LDFSSCRSFFKSIEDLYLRIVYEDSNSGIITGLLGTVAFTGSMGEITAVPEPLPSLRRLASSSQPLWINPPSRPESRHQPLKPSVSLHFGFTRVRIKG